MLFLFCITFLYLTYSYISIFTDYNSIASNKLTFLSQKNIFDLIFLIITKNCFNINVDVN